MKIKLPTKADARRPHGVCFYLAILKKQTSAVTCNILGGYGRKKPLCFSNKVPFHSEVGGGSEKPVAFHRDAHWKCRRCLTAAKRFFASEASERGGSGA